MTFRTGLMGKAYPTNINPSTGVLRAYLIDSPETGHLFWQHYYVGVIHLREDTDLNTPVKHYPEAEYEIAVYALDKGKKPVFDNPDTWSLLSPSNVMYQFHGVTDEQAADILEDIVDFVLQGNLLLEPTGVQGARDRWKEAIDSIIWCYQ